MSGQVKGLLITAAVVYLGIVLYHKGMLPLAAGPKLVKDPASKAGE